MTAGTFSVVIYIVVICLDFFEARTIDQTALSLKNPFGLIARSVFSTSFVKSPN